MEPFERAEDVITAILTSTRCWHTVKGVVEGDGLKKECLHVMPWREEVHTKNEWKVFVPPGGG